MRAEIGEAYEASTTPTRALEQAKGQRLSLRRAIDEFRDVLDAPGAATTERLAPVLDHLKVVFGVHVEVTETPGGLYEEILEIAPRLANKIARFKREHVSIRKAIRSSPATGGVAPTSSTRPTTWISVARADPIGGALIRPAASGSPLATEPPRPAVAAPFAPLWAAPALSCTLRVLLALGICIFASALASALGVHDDTGSRGDRCTACPRLRRGSRCQPRAPTPTRYGCWLWMTVPRCENEFALR